MTVGNNKISLACDHRGYVLKEKIKKILKNKNYEVFDCGAFSEASIDYTDPILAAAEKVGNGECALGIGICYTGIGSSIAANKVQNVRASLCQGVRQAELTRQHNDSNMLILGAGFTEETVALEILEKWLTSSFEGGRHESRVNKIKDYERKHGK